MKRSLITICLLCPPLLVIAQGQPAPRTPRNPANMAPQPVVIVEMPPTSATGTTRQAARPPAVAPVSPGQDTYSSTGATPASVQAQTHSSSGRIQDRNPCVQGGVARKCE